MFSGPPGEALGSDKAPVEVFSLGQFRILANGKPLRFGHKTPLKPLTLLKLIIALGGESVPVERISDALWPDSDGDRAQWAFSSALHRLRKLIGTDAVLLDGSRLTIDPGSCWVDCAAFARCLDLAREAANAKDFGEATRFSDVAASLYAGPFLQNEFEPSDLLIARERLDSRFLEHINLMGFFFSEAGQAARALPLYERGVEISPLDEDLHRRLMQAYLDSGRRSDAIATYRLLCSKLKGDGGREPSPQTRTLLSDLVDGQAVWAHEGKVAPNAEVLPGISEPDNKGTTPSLATPCLAVLPFKNITSDPQEDYFSAGLTDELITALSRISLLSVVSPNSLSSYRDGVVNLHRAVKELGVSHILEGSVRKSEARLRITAQLVKADTGQHVWAERYDRDFGDIFSVQDDITLRLVTALDVQILEGEQARLWRRSTHSSDAYDMFLRARSIWQGNLTRESCIEARQLLKDAIELDSEFVRAYPTLAVLDIYEAAWGWSEDRTASLERALQIATKALEMDATITYSRTVVALYRLYRGEHEVALAEAERAFKDNPAGGLSLAFLADIQLYSGRPGLAIQTMRRAKELTPDYPAWYEVFLGQAYLGVGEYGLALAAFLRSVEKTPAWLLNHVLLAATCQALKDSKGSRKEITEILRLEPDFNARQFIELALPYKNEADRNRILSLLYAAGLPA